jgi:CBS domain-containing protein
MTNRSISLIVRNQDPLMLAPTDTLQRACTCMYERRAGAVLVTDDGKLIGIVTGRDIVHALADGRNSVDTTLSSIMTGDPDAITPDATALDALRMMADRGYRHLPVIADDNVVGIVSRGDFKGLELDRLEDETSLWERIG